MTMANTLRSAFVIGRRDFSATVFSKTFLLFLLGPLFPIMMVVLFGGIGSKVDANAPLPTVAVIAPKADFDRLTAARNRLSVLEGERPFVQLTHAVPERDSKAQVERLLNSQDHPVLGVLDGGLLAPHFTGAVNADGRVINQMRLFIQDAHRGRFADMDGQEMQVTLTESSSGRVAMGREVTARIGQGLLFLLTILLAGMLLSQLIEEKSNKVIEVLAAAVPVDAIFMGKLFAMLAVSLVGITVWTTAGAIALSNFLEGGLTALPAPAVGWPAFIALMPLYFAMSYLLIGATFLGIGAQASTVREVQTLSMPVTMAQVVIFGLSQLGVGKPDSPEALAAAIFPLSSPFAMIARAAEVGALWPHALALLWQALWVALIIRLASRLFRRSVLKSGKRFRWPWQRRTA